MRSSFAALPIVLLLAACVPSETVSVQRLKTGKAAEIASGEKLEVKHLDTEKNEGVKPGFSAIKSADEWAKLFGDKSPTPEAPHIDWAHKMVLTAVSDWAGCVGMRIHAVVEGGIAMSVYAKEELPGEGCPVRPRGAFVQDLVIVDRTEKPIRFYVERDESPTCGAPPTAKVTCAVDGEKGLLPEILVKPGDLVSCAVEIEAKGTLAVVDTFWSFGEMPRTSHAKLEYLQGGDAVRFRADVLGRFAVRYEVTDEGGRRTDGMGIVVSGPGKAPGVYTQLAWQNSQGKDEAKAFPKVIFEAQDRSKGVCSSESKKKPKWCDVVVAADQTALRIATQEGTYPMRVKYIDERPADGPAACVTVFVNGSQAADLCDNEPRKAGDTWILGGLVARSGTFEALEPEAPAPDPKPATTATAAPKPTTPKPATPKPVATTPKPATPKPATPAKPKSKKTSVFAP